MPDRPTDDETTRLLAQANERIRHSDLDGALSILEHALSVDFDSKEVIAALKFVNFWIERDRQIGQIAHPFERGEMLLGQWPVFEEFVERGAERYDACMHAVRRHVFGSALSCFQGLLSETEGRDAELLLRIGRCHKGLGAYDEAVRYLEAAAAENSSDAEIDADLADAYALVNEEQMAKAFLREAFFLDAQRVHLEMLESEMIRALVRKVRELGLEGRELLEWLPVYGVLFGVLNVKRELRSIEYGKLKQSIYALEREIQEGRNRDGLVEPRLINRYFWLIDHLVSSREDPSKIDEVLLKLRGLNERIYKQYTN
jgi:tetratricopeptide (TPR) repeat protein